MWFLYRLILQVKNDLFPIYATWSETLNKELFLNSFPKCVFSPTCFLDVYYNNIDFSVCLTELVTAV